MLKDSIHKVFSHICTTHIHSLIIIISSLCGTKIFLQLFPAIARHLLSTRKLQTYIFVQDCDKHLEIIAVLFGRDRSVIVVTIGSEVESVLKVGRGRLLGGAERSSIDPRNVCQQLGQPQGCLIGWVKVTTCLPARPRDAVVSLPTYVHSRAPHRHMPSRAHADRGNATIRSQERNRKLAKSRVGGFFRNLQSRLVTCATWMSRSIMSFGTSRSRDTIPEAWTRV